MKNILYIGNKLNHKHSNVSSIDTLGPLLEQEGYTLYYASSRLNKVLRLLEMLFACVRFRRQVDVVIIDTYSTLNFYYAFFVSQLCRILKLKYIASLNGGDLPNRLNKNPFLCGLIFKYAYNMVSPSLYLKEAFEKYGYANVIYIPNTIELKQYQFKEQQINQAKLLWVRSFSRIYNPLLAIKVLKQLQDQGVQSTLCMVGPDSDGSLQEVKTMVKRLQLDVQFTGKLTKGEWIALSEDHNIFINTTNFDNMPVSVIEAMALGLVVVSTNVGGMPFLIKNNIEGILVEPNDEYQFANAIKEVLNNENLANQLRLNARMKVKEFDWDKVKYLWFKTLQ